MASKVVTIPKHTTDVQIQEGKFEKRNTLLHLIRVVNNVKKQKTDTETILSHGIDEKLNELADNASVLEMEAAEIDFIQEGIKQLRVDSGISGPAWYYIIQPLRDAVDKKVYDRKVVK